MLIDAKPLDLRAADDQKMARIRNRLTRSHDGAITYNEDEIHREAENLSKNLSSVNISNFAKERLGPDAPPDEVKARTAELIAEWPMVRENLEAFTRDMLKLEADKVKTKDTIDNFIDKFYGKGASARDTYKKEGTGILDEELEKAGKPGDKERSAQPKPYKRNMDILAAGSISALVALIVAAFVWPLVLGPEPPGPANIPLQVLQSEFMLALIGAVIAPVVVRVMKEKYDIEIEESQVTMIMTDAIKAAKLYQNEANKLRGPDGRIPPDYQAKLRDLAFDSIKSNYSDDKYKTLAQSVGIQVFDKAIEEAVKRNWMERFPLEKEQVEALIKQSIDAFPYIVEWRNLDESVKTTFLEGHVKKLLATAKLDGWGYQQISEIFDAEISKRLLAAAVVDGTDLLKKLKTKDRYVKYTSTVVEAVAGSLSIGPTV